MPMDLASLYRESPPKVSGLIRSSDTTTAQLPKLPPDVSEHVKRLGEGFGFSRWFIYTYQTAIFAVVILVAVRGWVERWTRRRRRRRAEKDRKRVEPEDARTWTSSSSSSNKMREDNASLLLAPQAEHFKTSSELSRLLDSEHGTAQQQRRSNRAGIWRWVRWATTYQPAPIPLLNKVLPENTTTISVLLLLALNIFFLTFNIRPSPSAQDILADRAGLLFAANLPWLYLLSAKNSGPMKFLTGYSYENLNLLHRRLGEWMCFLAAIHLGGFLMGWYDFLRLIDFSLYKFLTIPYVLWGCGAWVCYEVLYFSSLGTLREWNYEIFLASHILLQAGALVCLFLHHFRARGYVGVTLGIFVLDRVVWRLRVKRCEVRAELKVLEDGETVLVSADWFVVSRQRHFWRGSLGLNMQHGWLPSQHVFITIPGMGGSYALQAHPMTISSAAPSREEKQTHAWFNLIIRAKGGFSRDLLHFAQEHDSAMVRLDGPYGSMHALQMLRDSDVAVIVAGGSGIAVAYPMLWDLLHRQQKANIERNNGDDLIQETQSETRQEVCLIWIVQDASHVQWIGLERLSELEALGLHLVLPGPSRKSGRPDVKALLTEKVEELDLGDCRVVTVVSGPDGLNRSVRNCCAEMVRGGREVDVVVEKFGW